MEGKQQNFHNCQKQNVKEVISCIQWKYTELKRQDTQIQTVTRKEATGIAELLFEADQFLVVMSSLSPNFLRAAQQSNVLNASPSSANKIAVRHQAHPNA